MPEVMTGELVPVEISYDCDECSEPVLFIKVDVGRDENICLHACPDGHEVWLSDRYPRVAFRRKMLGLHESFA